MSPVADLRTQLLAAFAIEFREHLAVIRREIGGLGRPGGPPVNLKDAFRRAHSLKGAARAVDLPRVEEVAHRLESLFDRLLDGRLAPDRPIVTILEAGLDVLEVGALAGLAGGAPPDVSAVLARMESVLDGGGQESEPVPSPPGWVTPAVQARAGDLAAGDVVLGSAGPGGPEVSAAAPRPTDPATQERGTDAAPRDAPVEFLRVAAADLDALWGAMHRLSSDLQSNRLLDDLAALRTDFEALRGELGGGRAGARATARVADLAVHRAGSQAVSGSDPAEAARVRLVSRVRALQSLEAVSRRVESLSGTCRAATQEMDRSAAQMRRSLERLSLVPAETVFGGFGRILRDLARAEGIDIDVQVLGLNIQADRRVLQALSDPVLHVLRNALRHAAESPETRQAAGKAAPLRVELAFAVQGSGIVVSVRDDGRGPDLARIEAIAIERGMMPRRAPGAAPPSPEHLLDLVFEPGFSTAEAVDRIAGRGMGLSVVAEAAQALGGTVRLLARRPHGAEIVIKVPLSSQRQALVMVEAGGETYGLPSHGVGEVIRQTAERIETVAGRPILRIQIGGRDVTVPIVSLADLVDHEDARIPAQAGWIRAVLLSRGERWCAVAVDAVREAGLFTIADVPDLGQESLVTGAVLLGQGLVPVLNAEALVDRWMRGDRRPGALQTEALQAAAPARQRATTILVVDDSVTTRTLEKSILEAQGYRVLLSVDGLDALTRLRAGDDLVDLVITDVEMPRMDGFGLLQALRADPDFASLPVVLMTSRAAPEDVRRGLDLGAQAYVTKQAFDQGELLATIGRLL